jgi:hypothetical protein
MTEPQLEARASFKVEVPRRRVTSPNVYTPVDFAGNPRFGMTVPWEYLADALMTGLSAEDLGNVEVQPLDRTIGAELDDDNEMAVRLSGKWRPKALACSPGGLTASPFGTEWKNLDRLVEILQKLDACNMPRDEVFEHFPLTLSITAYKYRHPAGRQTMLALNEVHIRMG